MISKNSIVLFLKDYLIKFLTRPFLLDTNDNTYKTHRKISKKHIAMVQLTECDEHINTLRCFS